MIGPRQPFRRISWLDQWVRQFQDRWETNPQYRSVVSAVVAIGLTLTLCSCVLVLTATANSALANFGLTNGNSGANINSTTGTGKVQQASSFPTATFGPLQSSGTPSASPVANSQTPQPNITPTDTPPDATSTPGGGNNAPFVCTGRSSGVTWTFNPCPLVHGQGGRLTISAPRYPNDQVNIILTFGNCTSGGQCTDLWPPPAHLNANGIEVQSFVVPADVQVGGPPVTGTIEILSGPTTSINTHGSCQ